MGFSAPLGFTVRTDVRNGVARLALIGELDMAAVAALQTHLDRVVNDGVRATMIDLRELTFMDSTGLHVLITAPDRAKQNGHRVAVVGVGGAPRKLLQITGTDGALIDEESGAELARRFSQPEPASASIQGAERP